MSNSHGCTPGNKTEFLASASLTEEEFQENPIINWDAIIYVNRPTELWAVQLVLALISLTEALLLTYLGYKVNKKYTRHTHTHTQHNFLFPSKFDHFIYFFFF